MVDLDVRMMERDKNTLDLLEIYWKHGPRKQKSICGALRDLVPFVQSKKHENTHEGVLTLVKL